MTDAQPFPNGPGDMYTAAELMAVEFAEPRWAVPYLLPEGLGIPAGKPKVGKSWLALGMALKVAAGESFLSLEAVESGDVLYMALEDRPRRLQERIDALLGGSPPPADLYFSNRWLNPGDGGLEALEQWIEDHPKARLVIIDTLQPVKPVSRGRNVATALCEGALFVMSDYPTNPVHGQLSDQANTPKRDVAGGGPGAVSADPPGAGRRREFSIREVADLLCVSERLVRPAIESGVLRAARLGRRVLVPAGALDEFLAGGLTPWSPTDWMLRAGVSCEVSRCF